ncbi:ATP-binding cassette domain-containing protein, partial [Buchnera aphidicola]|nr:ATP-binding cassette domain-containing protein [Buchnera aphidicola]
IIKPGKILGICGPTGSGKSTILKIIQYQFQINKGDIFYHSISLSKFKINHWRKKIAIVNQNIFLFSDTIAKNIALGKPDSSQEDIEKAAK